MTKPPCSYVRRGPSGEQLPCLTPSRWTVRYLTPDDGTMRKRVTTVRCHWHSDDPKFFPKGATGITLVGSSVPDGSLRTRDADVAAHPEGKT